MKQMKKLTRNQKEELVRQGVDPKQYGCVMESREQAVYMKKDGSDTLVVDRMSVCRK